MCTLPYDMAGAKLLCLLGWQFAISEPGENVTRTRRKISCENMGAASMMMYVLPDAKHIALTTK